MASFKLFCGSATLGCLLFGKTNKDFHAREREILLQKEILLQEKEWKEELKQMKTEELVNLMKQYNWTSAPPGTQKEVNRWYANTNCSMSPDSHDMYPIHQCEQIRSALASHLY